MKLYNLEQSYNSRKVRATIHELGLDVEIIHPNVMQGEHKKPEMLLKNPNAKLPILEDGDFILWESHAIMSYLVAKAGDSNLSPKNIQHKAEINKWLFWDSCNLNQSISTLTFELVLKKYFSLGNPDQAKVEKTLETLKSQLKVLDSQLENKDYIADSLSIADFSLASDLAMRNLIGLDINNYPNVKSWLEKVESLDSWKKSESNK
ncbi:MAG: glutathione S-transferase family protein [Candidatus Sericytochromatia bacterium]